jgi:hypothetical protein
MRFMRAVALGFALCLGLASCGGTPAPTATTPVFTTTSLAMRSPSAPATPAATASSVCAQTAQMVGLFASRWNKLMAFPGGRGWRLTVSGLTADVANWVVQVEGCPHWDLIVRFSQALGAMCDDEQSIDTTDSDPWDATGQSLPRPLQL